MDWSAVLKLFSSSGGSVPQADLLNIAKAIVKK